MTAWYNENDDYAADWLENLILAGIIAPGVVDRRSIVDVRPNDLRGFKQCHFFAGVGGWSLAFRRSGIPDDEPVWSASCPCPPWSRGRIWHRDTAGTRDARDLWPAFFPLVAARMPRKIYGEQVSGTKALPWIGRACGDLAGVGYCLRTDHRRARDYGSSQGRERFYFSADLVSARRQGHVTGGGTGAARPWRWRGEEDLRAIANAPFEPGDRWPQPLVRRGDDGLPTRTRRLRAYGNAIDPWVAAEFICGENIVA